MVLGPEKLPRVVSEVGRWLGRARAMARQFREQLEEEVQLEQARKAQASRSPAPAAPLSAAAPGATSTAEASAPLITPAETFSHAHATDATGADPTAGRPGAPPSADERGA